MGCYDTIAIPCPKCGELYYAQSKSGDCLLKTYYFANTPPEVMSNVNRHAPFTCSDCGTMFRVNFTPEPKIVETTETSDDFPEPLANLSKENIRKAMEEYYSNLDKK